MFAASTDALPAAWRASSTSMCAASSCTVAISPNHALRSGDRAGSRSLYGSEAASDLSAAYTFSEHGAAAAPMPVAGKA